MRPPAPYSPEPANATDPALCASFHPKRRVLLRRAVLVISSGVELVVKNACVQGHVRRSTHPSQHLQLRVDAPTFSTHPLHHWRIYLLRRMCRRSLAGDGPGGRMRPASSCRFGHFVGC